MAQSVYNCYGVVCKCRMLLTTSDVCSKWRRASSSFVTGNKQETSSPVPGTSCRLGSQTCSSSCASPHFELIANPFQPHFELQIIFSLNCKSFSALTSQRNTVIYPGYGKSPHHFCVSKTRPIASICYHSNVVWQTRRWPSECCWCRHPPPEDTVCRYPVSSLPWY